MIVIVNKGFVAGLKLVSLKMVLLKCTMRILPVLTILISLTFNDV